MTLYYAFAICSTICKASSTTINKAQSRSPYRQTNIQTNIDTHVISKTDPHAHNAFTIV